MVFRVVRLVQVVQVFQMVRVVRGVRAVRWKVESRTVFRLSRIRNRMKGILTHASLHVCRCVLE